ncbi:rCG38168 [Rattus norvegicus]|uniref:RCG38168 n=1 Tax=Rattus norvegicus TaxID=10116 RepID=A6IVB3_RAT|nr:rCG38168 [Rattus norvegicus]
MQAMYILQQVPFQRRYLTFIWIIEKSSCLCTLSHQLNQDNVYNSPHINFC